MPSSPQTAHRRRPAALLAGAILATLAATAGAQGGPPMVTDDPDTPGNGKWEINLASLAQRTSDGWLFTGADADINYGWGDRIQLKLDAPWNFRHQDGVWSSGFAKTELGVKWRFLDDDSYSWTMSTYPQVGLNPDSAAVDRGLTDAGRSAFLPLEAATHLGPVDLDVEFGRELHQSGQGNWVAGVLLAHTYAHGIQVMVETREHWSSGGSALLVNLGSRWQFSDHVALMAAIGREAGAPDPGRLSTLAYLGFQIHE